MENILKPYTTSIKSVHNTRRKNNKISHQGQVEMIKLLPQTTKPIIILKPLIKLPKIPKLPSSLNLLINPILLMIPKLNLTNNPILRRETKEAKFWL